MGRLTECIDSHVDNGKEVKEYSLNSKIEFNKYSCMDIPNAVYNKLGELEDVLEEFEFTSAEDLRNHLNFKNNMAIWEGRFELESKNADLERELAELKAENEKLKTCKCCECQSENEFALGQIISDLEQQLKEKDEEIAKLYVVKEKKIMLKIKEDKIQELGELGFKKSVYPKNYYILGVDIAVEPDRKVVVLSKQGEVILKYLKIFDMVEKVVE